MIAELISVGTELLMGQILDTNSQYLSQELNAMGFDVYYKSTVGDNPERMKQAFALALSRSDIVITTGGLGPTEDDITKEMMPYRHLSRAKLMLLLSMHSLLKHLSMPIATFACLMKIL